MKASYIFSFLQLSGQMGNSSGKKKDSSSSFVCAKSLFTFTRIIGKGGFGRVWLVQDKKSKKSYALKVIDKARVITKRSVQCVMNERVILASLANEESDFLVNMRNSFQDRQNCYLLIDYLEGGDLRNYINRKFIFTEEQIRFVIRCIIEGLNHLHQRSIIHRDIKPENILLDSMGYACITDLGIAKYWKPQNSNETSGTPGYMAPQVMLRQNHSFAADLFAVGVVAYELFVGIRPYAGRERRAIRDQMLTKQAKLTSQNCPIASKDAMSFVNGLLQRTAKKRLGYGGMSQIIGHPWLYANPQERLQFLYKRQVSPIPPLKAIDGQRDMHKQTEPDQIWRQNILLLKRQDVQQMFKGYQYTPPVRKLSQSLKASTGTADTL